MLSFSLFLPQMADQQKRALLWSVFQQGEALVPQFLSTPERFPITRVDWVVDASPAEGGHEARRVGEWQEGDGSVTMMGNEKEAPGTLLHEIFHPIFAESIFGNRKNNDYHWAEAWCDAFRYCAEQLILPTVGMPVPSKWAMRELGEASKYTIPQVQASPHGVLRKYWYPASLILQRAGGTMPGLLAFWQQSIAAKAKHPKLSYFNGLFKYDPKAPQVMTGPWPAWWAQQAATTAPGAKIPPAPTTTSQSSMFPPVAPANTVVVYDGTGQLMLPIQATVNGAPSQNYNSDGLFPVSATPNTTVKYDQAGQLSSIESVSVPKTTYDASGKVLTGFPSPGAIGPNAPISAPIPAGAPNQAAASPPGPLLPALGGAVAGFAIGNFPGAIIGGILGAIAGAVFGKNSQAQQPATISGEPGVSRPVNLVLPHPAAITQPDEEVVKAEAKLIANAVADAGLTVDDYIKATTPAGAVSVTTLPEAPTEEPLC